MEGKPFDIHHPVDKLFCRLHFSLEVQKDLERYVGALEDFVKSYENWEDNKNDEYQALMFKNYLAVKAARRSL